MPQNYEPPVLPDEQVDNDEESLDSGNRKLGLVAGAAVLLLGAAIALVPAGNRQRIANGQMPSFELMGASVVAERPTEEAAPAPVAPAAEAATAATTAPGAKAALRPVPGKPVAASAAVAPAPATEVAPAPIVEEAPAAAPVEEPVAAAPAPEAPRNVTLNGRVLDENGRPLAGATVFVKGTGKFASPDQHGNYAVEVPANEQHNVVYGYGGYQDQEMRVRSGQASNVTLVPSEAGRRSRKR